MKNCRGSIDSIESMGLVDGPGIRCVVFLSGCFLRCKYCHNPEMWEKGKENYTVDELVAMVKKFKPYYQKHGGVTFSGGEPLLQIDFLTSVCKKLKEENIHIALDTAGVGIGNYEELLEYVDLVLLDIKHVDKCEYFELTQHSINESLKFIDILKKLNKKIWIRQVVVPGFNDNLDYIKKLHKFLKSIPNIEKVEFLPYHKMGDEKYIKLGIKNLYEDKRAMNERVCKQLYEKYLSLDNQA